MVTMINLWTVAPAYQDRLIDILTSATEASVVPAKGFLGATLHKSLCGTKVTMVAKWESAADAARLRENPVAQSFLAEALAIAKIEPGLYQVAAEFAAEGL